MTPWGTRELVLGRDLGQRGDGDLEDAHDQQWTAEMDVRCEWHVNV
jgi:hypothetical protein